MSNTTLSFTIQGDNEGYVTFTCPYCHSDFKLKAGEFQNDEEPITELFCPYCGLSKECSDFYSEDVIEKARELATNYMIGELNNSFGKLKRSVNRRNSIIKIDYKPLKKVNVRELKELDSQEVEFKCDMCSHHTKVLYNVGKAKIFCPYCGVDL